VYSLEPNIEAVSSP